MLIREERSAWALVVAPEGRLDSTSSSTLERRLGELLRTGERHIVFDFASVEYISSAGLRVLLMLARRLKDQQGELVLCTLGDSVKQVFDLAGFVPLFRIEPSRGAALARDGSAG